MTTTMPDDRPVALLSAPETRRFLNDFVKRRVGTSDADDVVQTVLCDALQAARIPDTESEMRRWLTGIARHKIADLHRKAGREQPTELPDIETAPAPVEERLMAQWAEEQVQKSKEAERTLRWMAREGEGEKLEQIAAEEKVEAATVRQRVSRMRRWMKERWIAELAAVAMIALAGFFVWRWLKSEPVEVVREPNGGSATPDSATPDSATPESPTPIERAIAVRRGALDACKRAEYRDCLNGLDRARDLDPAGDSAPEIKKARDDAQRALDNEKQGPDNSVPNDNAPKDNSRPDLQQKSVPAPDSSTPAPINTSTPKAQSPKPPAPIDKKSAPPTSTGTPMKSPPKGKPSTPDGTSFGTKSSSLDNASPFTDEPNQAPNAIEPPPPQAPPSQAAQPPPPQAQQPQAFPQQSQQSQPFESAPIGNSSLGPRKTKKGAK